MMNEKEIVMSAPDNAANYSRFEAPLPPPKPDPLGDIFPPIDPAPPFVDGQDFDMPF